MVSTHALDPIAIPRVSVVVDLIGDLDATLGAILADTLDHLACSGTTDVAIMTRHVTVSTSEGLTALERAMREARRRGCTVDVEPGNRRMRAAFSAARIDVSDGLAAATGRSRHLMIARHAESDAKARPRRATRSAA